MATSTAIELRSVSHDRITQRANIDSSELTDDILEASRLADSTVPDGGYGWVVVASCAILAWWVSCDVSGIS